MISYLGNLALVSLVLCGCASRSTEKIDKRYTTIAQDLARDTVQARTLNAEGIAWIEKEEWDQAEQAFKSALEADVTFGPAHNNLGRVLYHQGKYYLAAWEFQYAIKTMPYHTEPLNNLGLVLEEVGKLDDAVANYDRALALEPGNPEVVGNNVRARVRRGDPGMDVVGLLAKVVMADTRPDWRLWAQEKLALYRQTPATLPGNPSQAP